MTDYKCRKEDIGKTLLEIFIEQGLAPPEAPCGGKGRCGKCLVRADGRLTPPDEQEKKLLGDLGGFRLACLARAEGDFRYELAHISARNILTDFSGQTLQTDGTGRLMAVDIGTTTVAVYIIENGRIIDEISFVNPQKIHGADIISRLDFAVNGGREALKNELWEALAPLGEGIEGCVICGNTAIEHFVTGEDPSGIASLPFTPASLFGCEYPMPFAKSSYIAPCVAAYVGGDITLGAAAAGMDRVNGLTLYIDIGTNGEIVLADRDRALCCSAAAGPAFEGANIECGCSARSGAVDKVWYDEGLKYKTIDDAEAVGICGSGLIDVVAALLKGELLDETGRLEEERYYLGNVYISQKDIRALQTAKAAIAAGIKTLLYEMKKPVTAIEKVIIAGGFGMHIDPGSACDIGLIPAELRCRIEFMGNCAGLGAVNCALREDERRRAENFARRLEYIELSGHKKFNELYIEEMFFEG